MPVAGPLYLWARKEGKMDGACHSFVTQKDILLGSFWLA